MRGIGNSTHLLRRTPRRNEHAEMIDEPEQWARVCEARALNPRHPSELFEQLLNEHGLPLRGVLLRCDEIERQQAGGVPARIHTYKPAEAIDQQSCRDQQHCRRCDLTGHEQTA